MTGNKIEIKGNATIKYVETLGKNFDLIVEDGKVFIVSIMTKKGE